VAWSSQLTILQRAGGPPGLAVVRRAVPQDVDMGEEMLAGVRAWLDTSGRFLELRVARTLRRGGARVQPSFSYIDAISGAQREGDVLAHFHWTGLQAVPCSLTAVVEAKSGDKYPWVAFYDKSQTRLGDLETWFYFAHGPFVGITEPLFELWVGMEPLDITQVATHTVAAHTKQTSLNPANDAVRQVLSAAVSVRQRYLERQSHDRVGLVLMPLIVTAAPLVKCMLDSDGQVKLEEVDCFHVWGSTAGGERRRVYVLSESGLPQFAAALKSLARAADVTCSA